MFDNQRQQRQQAQGQNARTDPLQRFFHAALTVRGEFFCCIWNVACCLNTIEHMDGDKYWRSVCSLGMSGASMFCGLLLLLSCSPEYTWSRVSEGIVLDRSTHEWHRIVANDSNVDTKSFHLTLPNNASDNSHFWFQREEVVEHRRLEINVWNLHVCSSNWTNQSLYYNGTANDKRDTMTRTPNRESKAAPMAKRKPMTEDYYFSDKQKNGAKNIDDSSLTKTAAKKSWWILFNSPLVLVNSSATKSTNRSCVRRVYYGSDMRHSESINSAMRLCATFVIMSVALQCSAAVCILLTHPSLDSYHKKDTQLKACTSRLLAIAVVFMCSCVLCWTSFVFARILQSENEVYTVKWSNSTNFDAGMKALNTSLLLTIVLSVVHCAAPLRKVDDRRQRRRRQREGEGGDFQRSRRRRNRRLRARIRSRRRRRRLEQVQGGDEATEQLVGAGAVSAATSGSDSAGVNNGTNGVIEPLPMAASTSRGFFTRTSGSGRHWDGRRRRRFARHFGSGARRRRQQPTDERMIALVSLRAMGLLSEESERQLRAADDDNDAENGGDGGDVVEDENEMGDMGSEDESEEESFEDEMDEDSDDDDFDLEEAGGNALANDIRDDVEEIHRSMVLMGMDVQHPADDEEYDYDYYSERRKRRRRRGRRRSGRSRSSRYGWALAYDSADNIDLSDEGNIAMQRILLERYSRDSASVKADASGKGKDKTKTASAAGKQESERQTVDKTPVVTAAIYSEMKK